VIAPPTGLHADETGAAIFFAVAILYCVAAVAWALFGLRRPRGALPLILIAGGFVAALQESLIDRMIMLQYPDDSPVVAFTAMGVPQPLYMILIYGGFVGCGSYAAYRSLQRDPSGRGLWTIFAGVLAMDMAFEVPATAGGIYFYYGPQPFQVVADGWSLWVGFLAAGAPVLAGWMLHHLVPRARTVGSLVLLAGVPPLAWITVYFGAGWPAFITIGSDASAVLRYGGAIATMAIAAGMVAVLRRTLPSTAQRTVPAVAPRTAGPATRAVS